MNRVRITRVLAALTLASSLTGGVFAQQAQDWTELKGTWSGVQKPKQVVVQDEAAWKAVWAEHARGGAALPDAPKVDFSRETVVAVFLGNKQTSKPVDLTIERVDGEVVVAIKSEGKAFSMPVVSQPFEIVKFPKASSVRIQGTGASASAPKVAAAESAPETGLRDSVAKVSGRLQNVLARAQTDTLAFDGTTPKAASLVGGAQFGTPKAAAYQLPPPPGQSQDPQEAQPRQGRGNLPPPPGQQQPERRGNLPPPPGQGGQTGGNQGGNLPPPPQYHPRPSENGGHRLPPPPGGGWPSDDNAVGNVGYWHVYRDVLGYQEERFGSWQSEDASASITRGGSETGVSQGTRYTADLDSRDYRRRYVLYWRWVGYDCDPQDNDRCARWDREYKWFYEDTRYSRPKHMQVVVNFDRDQPLLGWERESMRVHYDGSRVWIEYSDPSFKYAERGPIVDQQTGVATITLTPTVRILRSPEREKVTAYLIKENGKAKLIIEDARNREYAGETLAVSYEIKKYVKWSIRHPFTFDQKVAERTQNGPERLTVNAQSGKTMFDLGLSESGAEFYIDSWSFKRENSKLSSGEWIYRGKGNRIQM